VSDPTFKGIWIRQSDQFGLKEMVPNNPRQVVFDMSKQSEEFHEEVAPIWIPRCVEIESYEDIADVLSPFDILSAHDACFYVGDESALDGSPPNPLATALWLMSGLDGQRRGLGPMPGLHDRPFNIYGPCLVAGPPDQAGYTTSAPAWAFEMVEVALVNLDKSMSSGRTSLMEMMSDG